MTKTLEQIQKENRKFILEQQSEETQREINKKRDQ